MRDFGLSYLITGVSAIGFWIIMFAQLSIWIASLFGYVFIEYKYAVWIGVVLFILFFVCVIYIKPILLYIEKRLEFFDEKIHKEEIIENYKSYINVGEYCIFNSKLLSKSIEVCNDRKRVIDNNKFLFPNLIVAPMRLLNVIGKKFKETNGDKAEAYQVLIDDAWYQKLSDTEKNKVSENTIIDFLYEHIQKQQENKEAREIWKNVEEYVISFYQKEIKKLTNIQNKVKQINDIF